MEEGKDMNQVIVIVGPTAVGKTKLSVELAKRYHGEIVNADAMQVYRGLDIGTAKIKEEEKENVVHHLFDIKEVDEEYSIYHYQKECRKIIEDILARGKTPILVGGTGLYIKSALYDYQLDEKKEDMRKYDDLKTEDLYQKLIEIDTDIIGKIDSHNRRRIINALAYYERNGASISKNRTDELLYEAIIVGLTTDRKNLYERINHRVDEMIEEGLVEEVRAFYQKKVFSKPLLAGIGYKELYSYFEGNVSFEDAIEDIKRNCRKYAKRQYTFFRHQLPVEWFETNYTNFGKTVEEVCCYINDKVSL